MSNSLTTCQRSHSTIVLVQYRRTRWTSSLSKARALASTRDVIDRYFDLLEETLLENELKDCPCQIFNMDESGMPLDPKSMKTIHVRGDPNPVTTTSGNKAQITVVACVSASGNYIPPMIIWDRKTLKQEWTTGEVAGTLYGMSSKGWMDMSLLRNGLLDIFFVTPPQYDCYSSSLMDIHRTIHLLQ